MHNIFAKYLLLKVKKMMEKLIELAYNIFDKKNELRIWI